VSPRADVGSCSPCTSRQSQSPFGLLPDGRSRRSIGQALQESPNLRGAFGATFVAL